MTEAPNIITYHSKNARPQEQWLAFCTTSMGVPILVRICGQTEDEVKQKAASWWNGEKNKLNRLNGGSDGRVVLDQDELPASSVKDNRGGWGVSKPALNVLPDILDLSGDNSNHHLAGKVWLIHHTRKEKLRVDPDKVKDMLAQGFERGGPRTSFRE